MALFRTAAIASVGRKIDLNALLDYFIPVNIQVQPEAHRRARMFMLSHVFGPFLGNVIPLYLHFILDIRMDYRFWVFFASITVFWIYPFILRKTQRYQLLAFVSIQNLIFCILWACYSYGGVYSPFLPWALIIPLLAFFYLPATGMVRNVIVAQIALNLAIFATLVINHFPFPQVDLREFEVIGIISTLSASAYVIMMALYFANIFRDQRAFERELASLVATSDHMIALTAAAQQATIAKADFVASMSHELRTPLNAVLGYSQILLEDADEEGEKEFASDVQRIHDAGGNLLRLIDDILDFSKLEAGKMVCRPTSDKLGTWLQSVCGELLTGATGEPCSVA
jgi:signal transduction histidine kinase